MRCRSFSVATALLLLWVAAPGHARAQEGFRADLEVSGGELDSPVTGVMYNNGAKTRLELSLEGQSIVMLIDRADGSTTMLMVEDKMYMQMPAGMIPFQAPAATALNPSNPCSEPGVTECVSLGEQEINGYRAAGWEYLTEGERWTSWIATTLSYPVRSVGADGTTINFRNISLDPLAASLFEIPSDFQTMPGFPFG